MMRTLKIGSSLQEDKYIIKEVLGQGGFGITYLADHVLLGTTVAIKEFFFKQYCDRDETSSQVTLGTQSAQEEVLRYQEKFLKEARIIAKLNHPNIIKVHDIFKENNTAYYIMDYIEGETLADIVKRLGTLSETEAIDFIHQAGEALAYIHNLHLNHLDVKPANLMLRSSDNKVVLIDFGMSKQYDTVSGNQTSTTPVGISHGYAPIEQYKEGGVKEFSPETDIYALGATLYKLLTGITPPQATDIVAEGWEPQYPNGINDTVKSAIAKAMEIRKNGRFHTVDDFMMALGIDSRKSGNANLVSAHPTASISDQNMAVKDITKDDEETILSVSQKEQDEQHRKEEVQRIVEEEWRKADEADRKRREAEEKKKKQYEEDNRKREEFNRLEEERKRLEEEQEQIVKEQHREDKKEFSFYMKGCLLVPLIAAVIVITICSISKCGDDSQDSNSSSTSQQQTTQETSLPDQVSHAEYTYQDGTIAYYWSGPVNAEGMPEGDGKLEYPDNDPEGRLCYEGYVKNGLRHSVENSVLTFKDGQKYVGSFSDDHFVKGVLTLDSAGLYFSGFFENDEPFNGAWFRLPDNKKCSEVKNGIYKVVN